YHRSDTCAVVVSREGRRIPSSCRLTKPELENLAAALGETNVVKCNSSIFSQNMLKRIKQRRWWIRPINRTLQQEGHYDTKFTYMKDNDHEEFYEFTRIYLAHGNSVRSESWNYRIGRSTTYKIIPQVSQAIWNALHPTYLPEMNQEKWIKVAEEFYLNWQFPNCIRAIDGKHIKISARKKNRVTRKIKSCPPARRSLHTGENRFLGYPR
ncbi:PREDICTED: uncharacterized protein LOC105457172, partial [Wasmannia auropunctata]|uniref:uncharacterized protein LOC105457172 n=1 Tax=Wasmannia auropunctata TaxID=64793 RepID=UPI0005EF6164